MMGITSSDDSLTFSSSCAATSVGEKRKRNEYGASSSNPGNGGILHNNRDAGRGAESAQPKISDSVGGPKFNDFSKLREEVNFAVGQTWALYDTTDGMPRLYAQIRKVSAPSFGLRITYLEPDPDDEKEILWFEQDLPVSVGKFRFGKSQNTKDRSRFSHLIHCNGGSNTDHFTVFPRKGETWALFKNWDINWSSEPDSHRKYEYDFVEILSDYADGAGVSVAFLHKAKGFASVFFQKGTGDADISQILPHSLYRFSHRMPSFKLTGAEGQGVPKNAYELDQAVLPKPEALCFRSGGKVFQTGQIWSYYSYYWNFAVYYGRIHKITFTQAFGKAAEFKLHLTRLNPTPFSKDVIKYKDKYMPVGCGTFFVRKGIDVIDPDIVSRQIVPETSMDGKEYTILPKIGDVWAIYTYWSENIDAVALEKWFEYDIVEVLDDALGYKVLALSPASFGNENEGEKHFLRAAEHRQRDWENESELIFTIPKSKILRFSHQIPVTRVTKEIDGDLKELFEVLDSKALPSMT
ncbi:PREDICTED: uncharacterized protein LOC104772358 [Camelina sativa]|uniref:Uncharacterized protein LOC104772358 n=1 Tax=Camelina sativa TaxID=90675 RepID=A0ABM1RDW5_CAMSA|nr:PREDICTED: uncharacterized protein LOC104772358 [Camelina sativa]